MSSTILSIVRALKIPVLFGGYMYLVHWGWQQMQYSPVVNQGKEPRVLSIESFKKVLTPQAWERIFKSKESKNEKKSSSEE